MLAAISFLKCSPEVGCYLLFLVDDIVHMMLGWGEVLSRCYRDQSQLTRFLACCGTRPGWDKSAPYLSKSSNAWLCFFKLSILA